MLGQCDGMETFLIKYNWGPCSMATRYSNQGHEIFGFVDFPSNVLKGWEWTSHVFLTRNNEVKSGSGTLLIQVLYSTRYSFTLSECPLPKNLLQEVKLMRERLSLAVIQFFPPPYLLSPALRVVGWGGGGCVEGKGGGLPEHMSAVIGWRQGYPVVTAKHQF